MNKSAILVLTGASGVGKTAAVRCLEARNRADIRCFYFDQAGVPSSEVMERDFGGPEAWQAELTKRWISRLAEGNAGLVNVLDGQTRPSFVRAAAATVDHPHIRIVLLDCSPAVRRARLAERGQLELAIAQMETWAAYLRGQADALGLPVINTTDLSVSDVTDALEAEVEALRAEVRAAPDLRLEPATENRHGSPANR